ncbi:MAG TPA: malto-oligosyltrehalose synthase [Clostridia bacterium]|nr:malto-oligosyltrehalose synthase [Clostridia bacterium]
MSSVTTMARIPAATYRLQFNQDFTFRHAQELTGYLEDLGISHVYASPILEAAPRSTHGYDVCCFERCSPALGGETAFNYLTESLARAGMGMLLDIVPNHMGNDLSNAWWRNVLELGPSSPYASWFDIDWTASVADAGPAVLLPILEERYAQVLHSGKLQLGFSHEEGLFLAYHEKHFPLAPQSCPLALGEMYPELAGPDLVGRLPEPGGQEGYSQDQIAAFQEFKTRLASLVRGRLQTRFELQLCAVNGIAGQPGTFDILDQIIRLQHYRLAFWRIGPEEINYRRFFDITSLVSLRMELPEVFEATHRFVLSLLRSHKIHGLRIDHPDGLLDPKQYFQRLQSAVGPHQENSPNGQSLYLVAEKILCGDEDLRADWPVAGTTGYDFLNRVNGLFVDSAKRERVDALYREFTGCESDLESLVYECKRLILSRSFISEHRALARRAKQLAIRSRYGRDFTRSELDAGLAALLAAFPVYRTYLGSSSPPSTLAQDSILIQEAVVLAAQHEPSLKPVLDYLGDLLLLQPSKESSPAEPAAGREFVLRFQQLTGPLMAKGLEDTAFYRFNRLVSLNEVGGDPGRFGCTVDQLHAWLQARARQWPHALSATATHDTKRGEDLRARINVLSELPEEWSEAVQSWARLNVEFKADLAGRPVPDPNDEYLLYQTLVGAWPFDMDEPAKLAAFRDRIAQYLLKAVKESKSRTSWVAPNCDYEQGLTSFITQILRPGFNPFLDAFQPFQQRVAFFGLFNSLSQLLIKLTAPGVPDVYQGTEFWDLSLVDPDNRRPVDFEPRRRLLVQWQNSGDALDLRSLAGALLRNPANGHVKMFLTWRVLQSRQTHRKVFELGGYLPVPAQGTGRENVCAYLRSMADDALLVVAPRLIAGLTQGVERAPLGALWAETTLEMPTTLPAERFRNLLTGEVLVVPSDRRLRVETVLSEFPVALLETFNGH